MSASRERKKRLEQEQELSGQKKKKKTLSQGWILAICVLAILVLVFGGILGYRYYQRHRTVLELKTGNASHDIEVTEFNYFYASKWQSLLSYASYFGVDTATPLDKQKVAVSAVNTGLMPYFGFDTSYFETITADETNYDITWASYLAMLARDDIVQVYALYDAAMAAGYQLDADTQEDLESEMQTLRTAASNGGLSVNEFLSRYYGSGCDEEGYRHYLEVTHIASNYPTTLTYTDAEIETRYAQNPEDYEYIAFYYYHVSPSSYAEKNEDGSTAEPTEENAEQAKAAAEAMAADFLTELAEDDKGSLNLYTDYTRASVESLRSEEVANWLFDTATVDGENVKLFQEDDDYYVVKLLAKGDYQTVNLLEISIADDDEETALPEGEQTAEEKVNAALESLKADSSETNYRNLLAQYNPESDGVVENFSRTGMHNTSDEIFQWCGMEERKAGDYQSFKVSGATLILYFTGYGESYRDLAVSATLRNEWATEVMEAAKAASSFDLDAALSAANVGIVLAQYAS